MSTEQFDDSMTSDDLKNTAKDAKEGANQNAGNLEVPGDFIMKVKVVKKKEGGVLSPVIKTMDSGAMMLSILLAVDDSTSEHNGKGLWASVWLKPKKIIISPSDTPAVAEEKRKEYVKKITNTLKMNLPSVWALTGDNTLNVDNWDRFRMAIGDTNPDKHAMNSRVWVNVIHEFANNKLNFRANRISPLPSMSVVSKVDLIKLQDVNNLRAFNGESQDGTASAPAETTKTNEVDGGASSLFTPGGAAVPGAAGLSFSEGEMKV